MRTSPPAWLPVLTWLPILIYFGVKYLVIGADRITTRQSMLLLGAVILAELALWQYRKRTYPPKAPDDHGADT